MHSTLRLTRARIHIVAIIRWYSLAFCFWNRWLIASSYLAQIRFSYQTHVRVLGLSSCRFTPTVAHPHNHCRLHRIYFFIPLLLRFVFKLTPHTTIPWLICTMFQISLQLLCTKQSLRIHAISVRCTLMHTFTHIIFFNSIHKHTYAWTYAHTDMQYTYTHIL